MYANDYGGFKFFFWGGFLFNKDGMLPLVLMPFASLEHLSFPIPIGASFVNTLLGALPAIRSLHVAVPLTHLCRAAPFLLADSKPHLERLELSVTGEVRMHTIYYLP
eukprot:tig00000113_g5610.t1